MTSSTTVAASRNRFGFRQLAVWQKAIEFAAEVYSFTEKFPRHEQFGLTSQLRRAAVSIPANIAEGYRRGHRPEYIQFLRVALGSQAEAETYLVLVERLRFGADDQRGELETKCEQVGKMLAGLIRSLAKTPGSSPTSNTPHPTP